MKPILLPLLILIPFGTVRAQAENETLEFPPDGCQIRYQYDASGNRIQRDWYCWGPGPKSLTATDSISAQLDEQLLSEVHMTVSPNPATDMAKVTFSTPVGYGTLEIFDAHGRHVYSQQVSGTTTDLPLQGLRQGNYWVSYTQAEERILTSLSIVSSEGR